MIVIITVIIRIFLIIIMMMVVIIIIITLLILMVIIISFLLSYMHFKSNVKQHWQCRGRYDENYHQSPHPYPHYHHGHHHLLLAGTGDAEDATMIVIITVIKPVEPTSYIKRSDHLRRTIMFVASKRNVLLVLC